MPPRTLRWIFFTLAALLLVLQLFMPPFVGIANNGDFPRVTGWLSIAPAVNGWADNFAYFVSQYARAPQFHWASGVYSSELPLAWFATRFSLDIRAMGAVHGILFLIAFWLALPKLTPLTALAVLAIFTDLSYTAYLNSFYMDTAALLGLLLMVALARRPGVWFTLAALLFIFSKPQHGVFGLLAAAVVWFCGSGRSRALAAIVAIATFISPFTVPRAQREQSLFNLIFFKIAKDTTDLAELGLPAYDARFIGMNAYTPQAPGNDPEWLDDFNRRSGYSAVARFYLAHPIRALGFLWTDLKTDAWQIRPFNLRNNRREDAGRTGFRYSFWTDCRSWLFRYWPWHAIVWYIAVIYVAIRRRAKLVLGLCVLGIGEFCLASLTDACETYRHLFIFHAVTDVLVCVALGFLVNALARVALPRGIQFLSGLFRPLRAS